MTNEDIAVGQAALKAQVQAIEGWEAAFVPDQAERDGAITIIKTWDSLGPMPNANSEAMGRAACGMALLKAITDAGYGSYVAPQQCAAAADVVIDAVNADRAKRAKPEATS